MFNIQPGQLAESIARADREHKPAHLIKAVSENTTWGEIINHINYAAHTPGVTHPIHHPHKNSSMNQLKVTNYFHMYAYTNDAPYIKNMQRFVDFVSNATSREVHQVGAFVDFVSGDSTPPHADNRATLFWQCQGSTEWVTGLSSDPNNEELIDTEVQSFSLRPGDLLYLPYKYLHRVDIRRPRASLSFDIK